MKVLMAKRKRGTSTMAPCISKSLNCIFQRKVLIPTIAWAGYLIIGGYIFSSLEHVPREEYLASRKDGVYQAIYEVIENTTRLMNISGNGTGTSGDGNVTECANRTGVETQCGNVDEAALKAIIGVAVERIHFMFHPEIKNYKWDLAGGVHFCLTVVSTIGYGILVPRTHIGRAVCVVYAIFGIPLNVVFMAGVGRLLTNVIDYTYLKWVHLFSRCLRRPLPITGSNDRRGYTDEKDNMKTRLAGSSFHKAKRKESYKLRAVEGIVNLGGDVSCSDQVDGANAKTTVTFSEQSGTSISDGSNQAVLSNHRNLSSINNMAAGHDVGNETVIVKNATETLGITNTAAGQDVGNNIVLAETSGPNNTAKNTAQTLGTNKRPVISSCCCTSDNAANVDIDSPVVVTGGVPGAWTGVGPATSRSGDSASEACIDGHGGDDTDHAEQTGAGPEAPVFYVIIFISLIALALDMPIWFTKLHPKEWYYSDLMYYKFITYTTIGFGDLYINPDEAQLHGWQVVIDIVTIVVGMAFLSTLFNMAFRSGRMERARAYGNHIWTKLRESIHRFFHHDHVT